MLTVRDLGLIIICVLLAILLAHLVGVALDSTAVL